tara:strand:- start:14742 stop:15497 length:756 start_codon:yes stop_codon:yes gene_type:complete
MQKKIALLIDIENVSHRSISDLEKKVTSYIKTGNFILVDKKAFANWNADINPSWYQVLKEHQIDKKHSPSYSKRKNGSDIELVVYAMELLLIKEIDIFIIMTGDSDFTSLVHKIKENKKSIIICSDSNASTTLKEAANDFWEISIPNNKKKSIQKKEKKLGQEYIKDKKRLCKMALSSYLDHKTKEVDMSLVYQLMQNKAKETNHKIDYKKMGYAKLKPFFKNLFLFDFVEKNKGNSKSYYLIRKPKKNKN